MRRLFVIISSALIGTGFYYWRQCKPVLNSIASLLGFGLLVHANMLVWMLFLPRGMVLSSYKAVALPVMTVYPVATLLLGMLLVNLEQKMASNKALLESQDRLAKSEEKYRMIIEHLPHRIFVKDRLSVYSACNAVFAADLGIEPEDIVGKTDYEFFPRPEADKYRKADQGVLDTGQAAVVEETYTVSGETRWIRTTKIPVKDDQGEIVSLIGAFEDINERKKWETQLADSEARLHELAHHMSQVREDEKKHLARELHDHLGQELTIIKLGVNEIESYLRGQNDGFCEKANSLINLIDQSIDLVRQTSIDLRPASRDFFGLEAVIQERQRRQNAWVGSWSGSTVPLCRKI